MINTKWTCPTDLRKGEEIEWNRKDLYDVGIRIVCRSVVEEVGTDHLVVRARVLRPCLTLSRHLHYWWRAAPVPARSSPCLFAQCGIVNEYAEPNGAGGTYTCFECRR